MSQIISTGHSSVHFDFESPETVVASVTKAVHDLAARAARSGGIVAWSTLSIDASVSTVSDSRITEKFERITVGRSTLTVNADVLYDTAASSRA